jgi:hypothetical protein
MKRKRPRDPNQLAKLIVGLSVGDTTEPDPNEGKNASAVARGRKGGIRGGKARAEKLSNERRAEIGRKAAAARWSGRKKKS